MRNLASKCWGPGCTGSPNRYRVVLVIEGGGSRGMFSAGMGLGLEELGLDRHPGHPSALGRHRVAALVSSFSLTSSS